MSLQDFSLFADYFQFYIQDESVGGSLADAWNEDAFNRMLAVAPGIYRVQIGYAGLATVSADILTGNDRYALQLWQGMAIEPTVLKQYKT